jgi:hypothetical protein
VLALTFAACAHRAERGDAAVAATSSAAAAPSRPAAQPAGEKAGATAAPEKRAPAKPGVASAAKASATKAQGTKPLAAKATPLAATSPVPQLPAAPPRQLQARAGVPAPAARTGAPGTTWTAEGCLTARDEQRAQAFSKERHPASGPAVSLEARPGGVVVVHRLAHACCLAAQVTARVEGGRYFVTERLTGKACRCVCESTIRTVLATPPGTHPLALDLYTSGGNRRAFEGAVEVK